MSQWTKRTHCGLKLTKKPTQKITNLDHDNWGEFRHSRLYFINTVLTCHANNWNDSHMFVLHRSVSASGSCNTNTTKLVRQENPTAIHDFNKPVFTYTQQHDCLTDQLDTRERQIHGTGPMSDVSYRCWHGNISQCRHWCPCLKCDTDRPFSLAMMHCCCSTANYFSSQVWAVTQSSRPRPFFELRETERPWWARQDKTTMCASITDIGLF